jgi:hypothetical protein
MYSDRPQSCVGVRRHVLTALMALVAALGASSQAHAEDIVVEFRYTPVARAQVALWIEDAAGNFVATVALTEAVAYRGIGNRPGASQMNSGYRWPYGRREGALPIWAHRRAAAPGAKLFPRVIFQSRLEGHASQSTADQSVDSYYCLSFQKEHSTRDKLDAISCATQFSSDKGRYLTESDVAAGYTEPWEQMDGTTPVGEMRPLPLQSVYPPRMDVLRCTADTCYDSVDVDGFVADVRAVMPEIDAVTRATALGEAPQRVLFTVPASWSAGDYVAFIEVNVEGDYNERWNDSAYPTPVTPNAHWDEFAIAYGYPYRGQPSIVFSVPFAIGGDDAAEFATETPAGRSSWEHWAGDYGQLEDMSLAGGDSTRISDGDGSGVDRLRRDADGARFTVAVRGADDVVEPTDPADADAGVSGEGDGGVLPGATDPLDPTIGGVEDLAVDVHPNKLRSHTWVTLRFRAPKSVRPLFAYEVRVATVPITDEASFIRDARPAKTATDDLEGATALSLPVDVAAGREITSAIGDLVAQTHYYVAVRATNEQNKYGPIAVAEVTTTERTFATVTPCFIATAAYGTPLASEIGVLRQLRDRYLASHAPGRALIAAYYRIGPAAASVIERHAGLRALTRRVLSWIVEAY